MFKEAFILRHLCSEKCLDYEYSVEVNIIYLPTNIVLFSELFRDFSVQRSMGVKLLFTGKFLVNDFTLQGNI